MRTLTNTSSLLLVLTLGWTMSFAQAPAKGEALRIEPYVFQSSKGENVDAEIGRLTVPENRRTPSGRSIELTFVRFKKTAAGAGAPIVYLAGGPGGSGISAAQGTRFSLFMAMREFGDVIALDQRGTGQSKPSLICKQRLNFAPEKAGVREEMIASLAERAKACSDQMRADGVDLSAYNTEENADDIESLRVALGAEKLNLWSISYGTHLALAVIKRHPKSVDRAIMAGVNGLDDRRKLPSDAEAALDEASRLAKRDAALAAVVPDLKILMTKVFADLEKGPVFADVVNPQTQQKEKVGLSKLDVQFITAQSLGSSRFITSLPALYYSMSKGDYSEIGRMTAGQRLSGLPPSAMYFAMDCASGGSPERYARIKREEGKTLLGNAFNLLISDSCSTWNVRDLGAEFRKPVRSNVPVLMISGTLDGRTPPARAEDVRKGFPNGVHLIVEGASHDDDLWFSSPVIKETMMSFMKGEKLLALRTVPTDPAITFRRPAMN